MTKIIFFMFLYILFVVSCTHAASPNTFTSCEHDSGLQAARSEELLKLAREDQTDRSGSFEAIDWNKLSQRDLLRRSKVAEIFAEGCFKTASDYVSAATVYQHGTTADHYYQSFLWSYKALQMGVESQRWWVAAAVDRYLVKIGHKQLFGTQLFKNTDGQWCIQSVEPSFPNSVRLKYVKYSIKEQIARTLKGVGANQSSSDVKSCQPELKSSAKGILPGFW